jgi:twitching motility protein PilT
VTLEQPIEYVITPRRSLVRQREVGKDTPTFAQGLLDALRQDPDVLMVGELRDPETMQLTLNAAETGHLVLATVHSSNVAEALQRIASAFAPEVQDNIHAQLADCVRAVISQRLRFREDAGTVVPECEVLISSTAAKAVIRQGQFFKLQSILETGLNDGSYTFDRYRAWLDRKTRWAQRPRPESPAVTEVESFSQPPEASPKEPRRPRIAAPAAAPPVSPPIRSMDAPDEGVLDLEDPGEDPETILRELEESGMVRRKH